MLPERARTKVQMQAHSAPLGLRSMKERSFHPNIRTASSSFSWIVESQHSDGYKVVRVKLDDRGQPVGGAQDFITGWLAPGETKKGRWMGVQLA